MDSVVAIGALGGSGTRAIAQVLIDAGIYLGDDLNGPNDNLMFTRLFKNPSWYKRANKEKIFKRLDVFNEYMERDRLSIGSAFTLIRAAITNPTFHSNKKLVKNILHKVFNTPKERNIWGWKEPNTQIYIDELNEYFANLKYIHVVRHGLDMAFSNNNQQLHNWGYKYGVLVDGQESHDEIAYKQMEYWVRSTQDAISKGKNLDNGFLLINHSTFCMKPKEQVDRIIGFLELDVQKSTLKHLYKIPKMSRSLNRYKDHDLNIFDKEQLDFVKEMGFNF